MLTLVFSNINGRRGFSFVTAVVVALGITTFLVLVGLTDGTFNEIAHRMESTNAELMVHKYLWNPATGGGWPLKLKFKPIIQKVPGVKAVIAVRLERLATLKKKSSRPISVYGISPEDFTWLCPEDRLKEGKPLLNEFDMVIDEVLAEAQGITLGEKFIWLGGQEFTIVGIAKQGIPVRILVNGAAIARFEEVSEDRVSFFFVKCNDSREVDAVQKRIENIPGIGDFKPLATIKLSGWLDYLREQFGLVGKVIYAVTVISLITSSMIIFLTMYQAVKERTREIGILKSLGASKRYLIGLVLSESLLLCVGGIMIGTILSFSVKWGIEGADPTMVVDLPPGLFFKASISALVGAALGALYPGAIAARVDPVEALTYE